MVSMGVKYLISTTMGNSIIDSGRVVYVLLPDGKHGREGLAE